MDSGVPYIFLTGCIIYTLIIAPFLKLINIKLHYIKDQEFKNN